MNSLYVISLLNQLKLIYLHISIANVSSYSNNFLADTEVVTSIAI